jgi:aryl sulfotransferase
VTGTQLPQRVRTYRHHHLDSTRWDSYRPRAGDVIISTSYKSGTTWMQRIMSLLVFGNRPLTEDLTALSPWIDLRVVPLDGMIAGIEAQEQQRFVKSHLPLDALPYFPEVRYIWIARDTRDVFMSIFNHYHSHTDEAYEMFASGDPEGGPLPRCPEDPREFWTSWMTRASFPWERDGWPYWSHHYHAESFWPFRDLPNVLAVHYNDLTADLEGQMRRVAAFTGIEVAEDDWPSLVEGARFESMKREALELDATGRSMLPIIWKGGAESFFYKGTNGRWRDVLTADDLLLYDRAVAPLDPSLRTWLENGSS